MTDPGTTANPIRGRCLAELAVLHDQLVAAHVDRKLFTEVRDAIIAADGDGTWLAHYAGLYWQTQAIRIRRTVQAKNMDDSVGLVKLIRTISRNPGVVDRGSYEALYGAGPDFEFRRREAVAVFDERWGDGGSGLSAEKFQANADDLMRNLAGVIRVVDKVVAHVVPAVPAALTFDELDEALDAVTAAWNDVYLLFTASTVMFELVSIPPIWRTVFREPLF